MAASCSLSWLASWHHSMCGYISYGAPTQVWYGSSRLPLNSNLLFLSVFTMYICWGQPHARRCLNAVIFHSATLPPLSPGLSCSGVLCCCRCCYPAYFSSSLQASTPACHPSDVLFSRVPLRLSVSCFSTASNYNAAAAAAEPRCSGWMSMHGSVCIAQEGTSWDVSFRVTEESVTCTRWAPLSPDKYVQLLERAALSQILLNLVLRAWKLSGQKALGFTQSAAFHL